MQYKDYDDVNFRCETYSNGRDAIELYDNEGPLATVTVNLPNEKLNDNEIFVKDYSENEGMLDWLIREGFVEDTGRVVLSGYVEIPVAKLTLLGRRIMKVS